MYENLRGRTILIGRQDSEQKRLMLMVPGTAPVIAMVLGEPHSVPNTVSRCIPKEGAAHCMIDIDKSGKMWISNLNSANVTYVDGVKVQTKKIDENSHIALGNGQGYTLDIAQVLKVVSDKLPQSITHLKKVWEEYEKKIEDIRIRQQRLLRNRMIPSVITPMLMALSFFGKTFSFPQLPWITIPLMIISIIIALKNFLTKDTTAQDIKQADEWLIKMYRCPKCHRFLGKQPYIILKEYTNCPHSKCRCEFVAED